MTATTVAPLDRRYGVMLFFGALGDYCRNYYQSERYETCSNDGECQKHEPDYRACCTEFNYCNFHSTNWFFWLIFSLVLSLVLGLFGYFCLWRAYKKRKAGRGDDEEYDEPSDTI